MLEFNKEGDVNGRIEKEISKKGTAGRIGD
jgi:hypothetical protein